MKPEQVAEMRRTLAIEAGEQLVQLRADLDLLASRPADAECRARLGRSAHTIASGAGRVGEVALSEFAGKVEACARDLRDPGFALGPERLAALRAAETVLSAWVGQLASAPAAATVTPEATATALALLEAFEAAA